jgi:ceramide glucosyltransferase
MIAFSLALFAAALLLRILLGHLRMQRVLTPPDSGRTRAATTLPSITVIRPIKGLDVGCRENTEALLAQDYPGEIETLFVLDSANDPAYPVVAEVVATARNNARIVFAGSRPARRTGKLNAMIHAFAHARNELVAFCDSDSRPSPGLLRTLVTELRDRPDAGATFAPAVTAGRPTSFAEVVYGLMINSWYGAAAAEMAGQQRELPFIMGQIMVFRRDALSAIGGLESAEGQLVDDMFLGAELSRAGYKNVMVRSPLHLITGPLGLPELSTLLTKWMAFSRSGLPSEFIRRNALRGIELSAALALTVGGVLLHEPVLALLAASALSVWVYSQIALYRSMTGCDIPLRFALWVPLVVPFLAGVLMAKSRVTSKVVWRGQAYELNGAARLAASPKPVLVARPASATPALLSVSQRLTAMADHVRQPGQRTSVV